MSGLEQAETRRTFLIGNSQFFCIDNLLGVWDHVDSAFPEIFSEW
jgi:hypothetical protein